MVLAPCMNWVPRLGPSPHHGAGWVVKDSLNRVQTQNIFYQNLSVQNGPLRAPLWEGIWWTHVLCGGTAVTLVGTGRQATVLEKGSLSTHCLTWVSQGSLHWGQWGSQLASVGLSGCSVQQKGKEGRPDETERKTLGSPNFAGPASEPKAVTLPRAMTWGSRLGLLLPKFRLCLYLARVCISSVLFCSFGRALLIFYDHLLGWPTSLSGCFQTRTNFLANPIFCIGHYVVT